MARPVGKAGPDYARISGGLPTGDELAKMGETVTFTVQLHADVGTRDNATLSRRRYAAGPDRTGNVYLLQIERYHLTRVAQSGTDSDWGDDARHSGGHYADRATPRNRTGSASTGGGALFYFGRSGRLELRERFGSRRGRGPWCQRELIAQAHQNARIGAAYYTPVFPNADGSVTIVLDNPDYARRGEQHRRGCEVRAAAVPPEQRPPRREPVDRHRQIDSETNGVKENATLAGVFGTDVRGGCCDLL